MPQKVTKRSGVLKDYQGILRADLLVCLFCMKEYRCHIETLGGLESVVAARETLELAHAMTLAHLHSRFPMCLCCLWD